MKMKCIGGLANGQIVEVEHGSYREGDQVRVPVKITREVVSFHVDLESIMNEVSTTIPYDYYKVCAIHWRDNTNYKRSIFYLCPIKWDKFEALAYVIGA